MKLTTPHEGREIDVTDEVLWDMGRVVYRVAGVGAFTIQRDPYGYSVDPTRRCLQCTYGVYTSDRYNSYRQGALPEAPVMFGITIGAAAVYGDDRFVEEIDERTGRPRWRAPLPMQRATEHETRGTVPDKTAARITDIVGALTMEYLTRPDREAIEHVQAVRLAPGRLNEHLREINGIVEEMSKLQEKLDHERRLADAQAALTMPTTHNTQPDEGATLSA